jgi:hypothetical protein
VTFRAHVAPTGQAERTAVLAYDRGLEGLNGLASQAQRERLRLENALR